MTVRHDPIRPGIDRQIDLLVRVQSGIRDQKFVCPTDETTTDQDGRSRLLKFEFVTVHESLVSGHQVRTLFRSSYFGLNRVYEQFQNLESLKAANRSSKILRGRTTGL